jgi:ERAP1-like C-terminal domain/Peptidase family M1 domain
MEFLGVEDCCAGFGIEQQFQSSDTLRALRADAFSDVQQLTQEVSNSAEIEGQFSAISYQKGASILKSLQTWLASQNLPNAFFNGIANYVASHAFGNAEPIDLWTSIALEANLPSLVSWAQTYELQPGYPLISLAWQDPASESTGRGVITVSQSRFFLSPYSQTQAGSTEASRMYWVPLTITGGNPSNPNSVIPSSIAKAQATFGFTGSTWSNTIGTSSLPFDTSVDGFVKIGVNSTIYARVNYPLSIWSQLSVAAAASATGASTSLTATDRGALLDDYFTFALSSYPDFISKGINTTAALSFAANFIPSDASYEANVVFLSWMSTLANLAVPDVLPIANAGRPDISPFANGGASCFNSLNSYVGTMLARSISTLGWNATADEPPLTTQLRSSVLSAASYFNVSSVVTTARAYYDAGISSIPPDLASLVLASVVRWGGAAEADTILALYFDAVNAGDSISARRYLLAVTTSRNRDVLKTTLDALYEVPVGDKVTLLANIAANPWGRSLAWYWITDPDNWAYMTSYFPPGGFDMSSIVGTLAGQYQTREYSDAVNQFWGPDSPNRNAISGALRDLTAAQEVVERAITWSSLQSSNMCAWLTSNYPSAY